MPQATSSSRDSIKVDSIFNDGKIFIRESNDGSKDPSIIFGNGKFTMGTQREAQKNPRLPDFFFKDRQNSLDQFNKRNMMRQRLLSKLNKKQR